VRPLNLLVYEPYPMGPAGGNLRTLSYILKFLDRSRVTPIIVTPEDTDVIARYREQGVEVVTAPPPPSLHRYAKRVLSDGMIGRLRSALDLIRYNRRLARLMRARGIDVVYCNSIRGLLLAGLGARLAGVPVLWYVKGALENGILDRLGFVIADRILFFCESNRDDRYPALVRWYRRKIGIVNIGLDPKVIAATEAADTCALRQSLDIREDRLNAIILGQVYPPKGQHFVLQGLRQIVDRHPEFMLYIVGDPVLEEYRPYRAELERIVERDGLRDHVRFTGWRPDALQLLHVMDLVIHPSLAEGFGRAVLEAMALGRPVVASAVGGLREIIRDGENGFLVAPRDTPALVDRILRLSSNPELRRSFGREARHAVFARYLIEDKVRELESIWQNMAAS
jgi:glycosyltransferase involved in cell wall biosynthesis